MTFLLELKLYRDCPRLAQSIETLTSNLDAVGSSPNVGKTISFDIYIYIFAFSRSPGLTEPMKIKSSLTFSRGNKCIVTMII